MVTHSVPASGRKNIELRIGFVPLLDAAPIIAACELGFFADEGLSVVLDRQIGWGNVRDKLTFGQLHASHALLGMPAASIMGLPRFPEPLVGLLSLGFGGNAITISRRLFETGVLDVKKLGLWLRRQPRGQAIPLMAHVFDCSTHHYLLRDWLSKADVNPDRDIHLCVLPPPQMVRQMGHGYIDGFCVGEPWNTAAELKGCGNVLALTTDVVPGHPEKVLAVARRWLLEHRPEALRLTRALLRAGDFCGDVKNRSKLIEILARPRNLDIDPEILSRSLALESRATSSRQLFYGITASGMFPSATHVAWLLGQMGRWGHLPTGTNLAGVAAASVDSSVYRELAAEMSLECPQDDFPRMQLEKGWFSIDSRRSTKESLLPSI